MNSDTATPTRLPTENSRLTHTGPAHDQQTPPNPTPAPTALAAPSTCRGAPVVRARRVKHGASSAGANARATLAREGVPEEVAAAYHGRQLKFGPEYIIPSPFDPRLMSYIPPFVAQAAMDTGVARKPIADMDAYRASLAQRLDPTAGCRQKRKGAVRRGPKKRNVVAEGKEQLGRAHV